MVQKSKFSPCIIDDLTYYYIFVFQFQIHARHNITVTKRVISDDLEETTSVLSLRITEKHFKENSSLKVRCTASIYSLYQKMSEINVLLQRIPVSKTFYRPENGSSQLFILPPPKGKLSQPNILVDRANREYNIHANERKYPFNECIHC